MGGPITERGLLRTGLALFGLFLAWRFLADIATIALLLSTGALLAVTLSAPVEALHRRKVPRSVSSALIAVGALALLGLGGYLFLPVLVNQSSLVASALPGAFSHLEGRVEELAGRFGLGLELGGGGTDPSPSALADWGRRLLGGALGLFGTLSSALLGFVVVVFMAFYLATSPDPVVRWVVRLFPPEHRPRARDALSTIRSSLLDWLKGRLLSMAIVGVLSIGALYLIGIPGALSLGLFAALVEFVPYVGPIISVIPPALLALAGDPVDALWVLLAYLVIQQVESYLITPLVMEETASLHPAVVIAAIAALGGAFGLLGGILALPMAVVARVLVEELWFRRLEGPEAPEKGGRGNAR